MCYRVRQFWGRLWAHRRPVDHVTARRALPPSEYRLFETMPRGDQLHALCVLERLSRQGPVSQELAEAALLHDVGKAAGRLSLAYRVAIVLLRVLSPHLVERLGCPQADSWRYPFFVHRHHAALGAEQCVHAGCSFETVALVRLHEADADEPDDPHLRALLMALRAADDAC
jgi:hypothetical protein